MRLSAVFLLLVLFPPSLRSEPAPVRKADNPVPLTTSKDASDYWPCFSEDGSRLFFSRRFPGSPWQVFHIPVAGGTAAPLFDPAPSPSGTRVARSKDGRLAFVGGNGIWLTDPGERNPRKLTIDGLKGNPSYPSWYPDGKHLLVVAYQQKSGGVLYRIGIESGTAAAITDPTKVRAGMASVSPDGKSIVFAGQHNDGENYDQDRNSIWILRKDGEAELLINHQGRAPSWSPDGRWIAYESHHGSPDQRQAIFIASSDGRTDERITGFEKNANHPVWSPDGQLLAASFMVPQQAGRTVIATIRLNSL